MGPSSTSNGHDGKWTRAEPVARDWVGRPLVMAGLLVGLGLLWSRVTDRRAHRHLPPAGFGNEEPRRGHEKRDVSPGWIFGVVLFLGVSGIAMHFILGGFMSHLNKSRPATDQWRPAVRRVSDAVKQPSFPLLQISPPVDLKRFREQEEQQLNTYGWINQTSGVVHIPIRAAMELVLKKGLPVRTAPGQAKTGPSSLELMHQRAREQTADNGGRQ